MMKPQRQGQVGVHATYIADDPTRHRPASHSCSGLAAHELIQMGG